MNKTICIFTAFYHPHYGGVETYVRSLSAQLNKLNYNVIIVTLNTEKAEVIEIIDGIKILRMPAVNLLNGRFPIPKPSMQFFKLLKEINKTNPCLYILNMRIYISSLLGLFISKRNRKPSLLIEHVSGHLKLDNFLLNTAAHLYEHAISKVMKLFTDKFYAVSQASSKWMEHFNIKPSGIIYNGVNLEDESTDIISIRKKYSLEDNDIIISYAGRLIKEKGIISLIETFNALRKKYSHIYLFIAGEGTLLNELKEHYSPNTHHIYILGGLKHSLVMDLLSTSDIIVNPTYYPEGMSTLLLEAGLNHCAVITTSMGGALELINDSNLGIVIKPNSKEEIYNAMDKLIQDKAYRELIAENLYNKVTNHFNWEKITENFTEKIKLVK